MNPKDTIIEETIGSLDGIGRAAAWPGLFDSVKARMAQPVKVVSIARRPLFWSAAAGLALLVALNLFSVLRHADLGPDNTTSSGFSTEYFLYLEPLNL